MDAWLRWPLIFSQPLVTLCLSSSSLSLCLFLFFCLSLQYIQTFTLKYFIYICILCSVLCIIVSIVHSSSESYFQFSCIIFFLTQHLKVALSLWKHHVFIKNKIALLQNFQTSFPLWIFCHISQIFKNIFFCLKMSGEHSEDIF